jgi:uncharacterized protein (DUF4213/DUF364 family)
MTTIAEQFVALAERIARRLGDPRVRALHLPPADEGSKDAEFCALELEGEAFGFSFLRLAGLEAALRARQGEAVRAGASALTLARGYAGHDAVGRALGFAAINALSQLLFARAGWLPPPADDAFGEIAPRRGEHVGMIGLFRPLIPEIVATGARLTVLELRAELAGEHGDHRVTLDPAELASCDKVVSTCTVMLNDTLDAVLAACRSASHFAIVGPTAGCVPDPLFARGVASIGGRRVTDPAGFRDALCAGAKWGGFAAKYVIARSGYPGAEALLDRVR